MSRRSVFGSLLALVLLVNLARVVWAPLLDPLAAALDASNTTLGAVATLAWLGSALPRLPTGYLLTQLSRQRVVLASGGVLTSAAVATSLAGDVPGVLAGAFAMGLASGTYFIAANPLVSELFPERVGTVLGVHGTAAQVGAVVAAPVVVATLWVGEWQTVLRVIAVVAALATVAFYLLARRTDLPAAGSEDRDLLAAARHQWRLVATGVAVVGVAGLTWNGLFNFYGLFMQAKGLTPGTGNLLLTTAFAAGVPAFAVSGRLADRLPIVPYMLAIVGTFVACVVALAFAQGTAVLFALSAITGYVVHSLFPATDTYLLGSLPDRHRGSAYAAYSATMMPIQAGGSVLVGTATDAGYSYAAVFLGLAGAVTLVLLALTGLAAVGRLPSVARA